MVLLISIILHVWLPVVVGGAIGIWSWLARVVVRMLRLLLLLHRILVLEVSRLLGEARWRHTHVRWLVTMLHTWMIHLRLRVVRIGARHSILGLIEPRVSRRHHVLRITIGHLHVLLRWVSLVHLRAAVVRIPLHVVVVVVARLVPHSRRRIHLVLHHRVTSFRIVAGSLLLLLSLHLFDDLLEERNQLLFFPARLFAIEKRWKLSLNFVNIRVFLRSELFDKSIDARFVFINNDHLNIT